MTNTCSERISAAGNDGICRYRLCASLAILFILQGCSATLEYLEPTPVDFNRLRDAPFYKDDCIRAHNQIAVPLDGGASMQIHAEMGLFLGNRYSDTPGTTLFGEVYVPAGSEVHFVNAKFTVRDGTGKEQSGTIAEITRSIYYAPKRNAGTSSSTQKFSGSDALVGWTVDDARSSGLIPATSYVDGELHNYFRFLVPWEKFDAPVFTLRVPDMVVNGRSVPGKSISFERVRKKTYGNPICS